GDDGSIVLSGYVGFSSHKQSLELLLRTLGFAKIDNRIVLISERIGGFGIVIVPRAFVFDRIEKVRENVTEILLGEPVFILREASDDHYWIQCADGYVGYASKSDVRSVTREQFTNLSR